MLPDIQPGSGHSDNNGRYSLHIIDCSPVLLGCRTILQKSFSLVMENILLLDTQIFPSESLYLIQRGMVIIRLWKIYWHFVLKIAYSFFLSKTFLQKIIYKIYRPKLNPCIPVFNLVVLLKAE